MDGERELVERVLGLARPLRVVLGLLTLLELVDGLAVAGGDGEVLALGLDLGLRAAEVQRGLGAQALRPLEVALHGDEVVRGDHRTGTERAAADVARGLDGLTRL